MVANRDRWLGVVYPGTTRHGLVSIDAENVQVFDTGIDS
jgi:hypothetical protein